MKSVYYLATSLDGFIADESGGVGWLDDLGIDHASSTYDEFFANIDGLIMGRATYDFVFNYGQWPYGDTPCWICSSHPLELLPGCHRQAAAEPAAVLQEAASLGVETLWVVGGGKLAASMLEAGLVTHIQVSVMPVLLGEGIPLVDLLRAPAHLHQESVGVIGGFTEIIYRVLEPQQSSLSPT